MILSDEEAEQLIAEERARERLLVVALPILQGLLASGHYTLPDDDERCVSVARCDNGKDWKEDDGDKFLARRHTALAIEDALELARELQRQIVLDTKREIESSNSKT